MPKHEAAPLGIGTTKRALSTMLLGLLVMLVCATAAHAATTVVTLGYDEGLSSQYTHRALFDAHGFKATYFVNTNRVGAAGYMTWAQLAELSNSGNEIGGNTLDHVNLTTVPQTEMQRQACDDRTALLLHGFLAQNFAYPFGGQNTTAQAVVQGCGYTTARTSGGTDYPDPCCVFAETIPPKKAMALRTYQPRLTTSLATLQDVVQRARNAIGGQVQFVLHGICDGACAGADSFAMSDQTLGPFLDWLATLPDVKVRTETQVLASATDSTSPSATLTAPSDGGSVTGSTTLTADASDNVAVGRVDFLVDGAVVGSDSTAPYSVTWSSASAGNSATVVARTVDTAGNQADSAPATVTVVHPDAVPPTVTLTAPADGSSVENTVTLSADAADNVGVDHVDFLVGGSVVGTDSSAPYSFDWDSRTAGASATITAKAYDALGNSATSAASTVTVKHASPTVVTLGFDDGIASQFSHRSILAEHGFKATYFINSGVVGNAGSMSWSDIQQLQAEGNEIAGHTISHPNLTGLTVAQQQHEVCDDRTALISHGFDVRNFAYPFGAQNATVQNTVAGCGYLTARTTGGTDYPDPCCVFAETVPPKKAYALRAFQPRLTTTFATFQDVINRARYSGGGWVNLVLHGVCDGLCENADEYEISDSMLSTLTDWIAQQPGVTVATEAQALHQPADTTAPLAVLTAPDDASTVSGTVTLTAAATDDVGVSRVDFLVNGSVVGSDTTAPYSYDWDSTTAPDAAATITARAVDPSGNATTSDPRTLTVHNADDVSPTVALTTPADGASVSGTVTLSATAGDNIGVTKVEFLVDGTVVGSDTTAPYSFGWDSTSAGSAATITARATDAAGNATTSDPADVTVLHPDVTPPAVTLTAPANGATVKETVTLTANASDDKGVDHVDFLVGGSVVGTDSTAPYTYDWDANTAGSSATIAARATDTSNNQTTSAASTVTVQHASPTVITLGFDDGIDSQYAHKSILDAHGVKGTYFINSGKVGTPGYVTWAQIQDLANSGEEIGGHTIDHPNLPTLTTAEQTREVCDDRGVLLSHGFDVRNFAYPFGAQNAGVQAVVQGCGYLTARTTGGTDFPDPCCEYSETIPPKKAYALRAYQPRLVSPLSEYQDLITRARYTGGGWVNLVLHGVCDGACTGADDYSINAATLDALLTWIAQQPNVTVKTEKAALGQTGSQPPPPADTTLPAAALTAPASGATVTGTTTITATASDNIAVARVDFLVNGSVVGSDTTAPYSFDWNSTGAPASSTLTARAVDTSNNVQTSAARVVNVTQPDTTAPTVALTAPANNANVSGAAVTISATASDNVGVTKVEFLANGIVVGTDTTAPYSTSWNSTTYTPSATLTAKAYDAAGNTKISTARTVNVADALDPTGVLTSPTAGSSITGTVALQGTATDNVGVTKVDFRVGGTVVGTDTTAPYSVNWNSSTAGSSASITMRSYDAAGNTFTTAATVVTVIHPDTTPPTVSLTSPANLATVGPGNVTIQATASDNVGVTLVDFLVGGVVVGSDSTAPYSFVWNSSTAGLSATLTARAHDAAGNTTTSSSRTVFVKH